LFLNFLENQERIQGAGACDRSGRTAREQEFSNGRPKLLLAFGFGTLSANYFLVSCPDKRRWCGNGQLQDRGECRSAVEAGGNGGKPAGNYNITVKATSGSLVESLPLTLTVQ